MHVNTLAAAHWSCEILHRGREACFLTTLNHLAGDSSKEIMCKVVALDASGMFSYGENTGMRDCAGFAEYQDRCDIHEMEYLENV